MGPESKTSKWIEQNVGHVGVECLIWPYGRDRQGYARAKVAGYATRLAHRIMCEMANGAPPFEKALARHTCGKGHLGCVNPKHLAWGSAAENNADKDAHGTKPLGEQVSISVLTATKVLTIREMSEAGRSQRAIASNLGVSAGTVQAVLEGRTWGHVK